jgi:CheY-like chemotaxis protein
VVEDNPADVNLVREALEEHGIEGEVIVATDGARAIRFIQILDAEAAIDCPMLVILDLNLPKRSGSEVLEYIRKSGRCSATPVVILSSSDAADEMATAARLGANRYLRKPVRLEEFLKLGAVFNFGVFFKEIRVLYSGRSTPPRSSSADL